MADNHAIPVVHSAGHPDMDYAEHEKTYDLFLFLTKWTVIGCIVLLVLMAFFLL
ncbi:MAG: aa3-type cytochrome c oxidase subunit IV [Beijerinckiaceae bacterium]|jgi:hypothetical protein|nr:aa3-type cytochrome c oxidase subunit IV [Beijerinckiaceae bacterium]